MPAERWSAVDGRSLDFKALEERGYLFGDEAKPPKELSILKAKMGCSPGCRGFDSLPCIFPL